MNKKQIIFAIVFCALAVVTLTTCKPREDSAGTAVCGKTINYTTNIVNSITGDCRESVGTIIGEENMRREFPWKK